MAHIADHTQGETQVILHDQENVRHRDHLSGDAAGQGYVVADAFAFKSGEAASSDDLTDVETVMSALGRAIANRMDFWVPFPGPDLRREQHWRRLSLVLQRHGLNLRFGRELDACPTTGGFSEVAFALRREVQAVDDLDKAVLAAVGAGSLGREIESALVAAGAPSGTRAERRAPAPPVAMALPRGKRYAADTSGADHAVGAASADAEALRPVALTRLRRTHSSHGWVIWPDEGGCFASQI